jgi:hypothetical protein
LLTPPGWDGRTLETGTLPTAALGAGTTEAVLIMKSPDSAIRHSFNEELYFPIYIYVTVLDTIERVITEWSL